MEYNPEEDPVFQEIVKEMQNARERTQLLYLYWKGHILWYDKILRNTRFSPGTYTIREMICNIPNMMVVDYLLEHINEITDKDAKN